VGQIFLGGANIRLGEQKYFKRGANIRWGKYILIKINNTSENFRKGKIVAAPVSCGPKIL